MTLNANALVTLSEIKSWLSITDSSKDARLESAIETASAQIREALGYDPTYQASIIEDVPGYNTPWITVEVVPVVSIASIVFQGSAIASDTYECVRDQAKSGMIRRINSLWTWTPQQANTGIAQDPRPGSERSAYTVTYAAGRIGANQSAVTGVEALPETFKTACIMQAVHLFGSLSTDQAVASESLMSYSVSYGNREALYGESGLLKSVEALLRPHMRVDQA